jgi:glycosyltransferase involved in cell wall biosynthesis
MLMAEVATSRFPGRILIVQRSSALDGSAHSGLLLADGLREAGWDTHVAFGFEGPMTERYAAAGHEVSVVPHKNWLRRTHAHQFAKDLWLEWRRAEAIERLIEETGADLVYVNTVVSLAGALAARWTGTPCIWHLREMFADIGGEMQAPGWTVPLVRWVIRAHADRLVANSAATARNLLGERADEATVIPNAVGTAFFEEDRSQKVARAAFDLPLDVPIVGVPATLRSVKGHPFFFDAVAPVLRKRPKLRVAVTGEGTDPFTARLERQIRDLRIEGQVEMLGWVEDMPAFYRACDLVCLPSRAEPFGRTAIEAFAVGTPVVATAVGGLQDIVTDGDTGLLVPYGDEEALAEAVRRGLGDADLREQLAEAARREGEEKYHERVYKKRISSLVAETTPVDTRVRKCASSKERALSKRSRSVFVVQRSSALDGSAHSGLLLADGLREAGWDTHVAFGFEGPMTERYAAAGHEVSVVPHKNWLRRTHAHQFAKDLWLEWRRAEAIERLIEETGADLVYVNTVVSLAGALAARWTGTPCIWHLREMFADIGGEMQAPGWTVPLVRWVIRAHADRLVANSAATARNLLGERADEATVIPNAVGTAFFEEDRSQKVARAAFDLPLDVPIVGVPATLRSVKGHPFFFDAVAPVLRKRPKLRVAVTGEGTDPFTARLERQIRDLRIEGQVEMLGWVEDMPAFYRACDLVCLPSRAEPFGRTAIEAFAVGTPVVATAVGGLQDIVTDGDTGLLVPYGDEEALAEAVRRGLGDADLREQLAEAARREGEEKYHERIYKERVASLAAETAPFIADPRGFQVSQTDSDRSTQSETEVELDRGQDR